MERAGVADDEGEARLAGAVGIAEFPVDCAAYFLAAGFHKPWRLDLHLLAVGVGEVDGSSCSVMLFAPAEAARS